MLVLHCLKVEGGIIAPVYMEEETFDKVTDKDISISIAKYGIDIKIKDLIVPIPEYMLDYFIANGRVTLCLADDSIYFWEPILTLEIPTNALIEANAIYRYKQRMGDANATNDESQKTA